MARRRNNDEPAVNLDSLMDALTNVVAVLLIVLILLQLDIGSAVDKMLASLPKATPEQLAALQKERATQTAQLRTLEEQQQRLAATEARRTAALAAGEKERHDLETTSKDLTVKLLAIDELQKRLAAQQPVFAAEKKTTDDLMAEIEKLSAQLDSTPETKAAPATVVRIPNSRAIPRDASEVYVLCRKDRLSIIDAEAARKAVAAEFTKAGRTLEKRRIRQAGKDRIIYDQEKVVKHFEARKLTAGGALIQIPYNRPWTRLPLHLLPDEKAAIPSSTLATPDGPWMKSLRRLKLNSRTVIYFLVKPDAFETYLQAREQCDAAGLPAGWEITGADFHGETLADYEVNNLEAPPPGDPNAVHIPAPAKKLD